MKVHLATPRNKLTSLPSDPQSNAWSQVRTSVLVKLELKLQRRCEHYRHRWRYGANLSCEAISVSPRGQKSKMTASHQACPSTRLFQLLGSPEQFVGLVPRTQGSADLLAQAPGELPAVVQPDSRGSADGGAISAVSPQGSLALILVELLLRNPIPGRGCFPRAQA